LIRHREISHNKGDGTTSIESDASIVPLTIFDNHFTKPRVWKIVLRESQQPEG